MTRREYLEQNLADFLTEERRILSWRAALAAALIGGAGALALWLGAASGFVSGVALAYLAVLAGWIAYRLLAAHGAYRRLATITVPSSIPPAHEHTADLPAFMLQPVDAPDLNTLDRILYLRDDDLTELGTRAANTGGIVAQLAIAALSAMLLVAAVIAVVLTGHSEWSSLITFAVLATAPGIFLIWEFRRYSAFSRRLAHVAADRAEQLVPALAAGGAPFDGGTVIHREGSAYRFDRTRMRDKPPPSDVQRVIAAGVWLLIGCAAVLTAAHGVLT